MSRVAPVDNKVEIGQGSAKGGQLLTSRQRTVWRDAEKKGTGVEGGYVAARGEGICLQDRDSNQNGRAGIAHARGSRGVVMLGVEPEARDRWRQRREVEKRVFVAQFDVSVDDPKLGK